MQHSYSKTCVELIGTDSQAWEKLKTSTDNTFGIISFLTVRDLHHKKYEQIYAHDAKLSF